MHLKSARRHQGQRNITQFKDDQYAFLMSLFRNIWEHSSVSQSRLILFQSTVETAHATLKALAVNLTKAVQTQYAQPTYLKSHGPVYILRVSAPMASLSEIHLRTPVLKAPLRLNKLEGNPQTPINPRYINRTNPELKATPHYLQIHRAETRTHKIISICHRPVDITSPINLYSQMSIAPIIDVQKQGSKGQLLTAFKHSKGCSPIKICPLSILDGPASAGEPQAKRTAGPPLLGPLKAPRAMPFNSLGLCPTSVQFIQEIQQKILVRDRCRGLLCRSSYDKALPVSCAAPSVPPPVHTKFSSTPCSQAQLIPVLYFQTPGAEPSALLAAESSWVLSERPARCFPYTLRSPAKDVVLIICSLTQVDPSDSEMHPRTGTLIDTCTGTFSWGQYMDAAHKFIRAVISLEGFGAWVSHCYTKPWAHVYKTCTHNGHSQGRPVVNPQEKWLVKHIKVLKLLQICKPNSQGLSLKGPYAVHAYRGYAVAIRTHPILGPNRDLIAPRSLDFPQDFKPTPAVKVLKLSLERQPKSQGQCLQGPYAVHAYRGYAV
ncbi:MAG: hypothetical protein EZS28_006844, partial [Streblomastix strix]